MNLSSFLVFVHLLYLVCLTVPLSASHRVSYNESCSRENRCDSRASLTCNAESKCDCLMPETMVYDSTRAKCVSLAGEKCIYTAVGGDMSWTDEVACVFQAKCVKGMCECNPEFYELSNGTCIEKRQHGESCSRDEMCHQSLHLVCGTDGTCVCNNTRLYDDTRKTCAVKAGNHCYNSRNGCIENAYCETNWRYICLCNSKYFQNTEGICERQRNYGESCNDNTYCKSVVTVDLENGQKKEIHSYLVCNNGTCGCDSEQAVSDEQNYLSTGYNICRKRLGKNCNENDKCLEGSKCTYTSGQGQRCNCSSTNYETENKTCAAKKGYGKNCKLDKECNQSPGLLFCDPSQNVCTCQNGTSRHPDFPEMCAMSASAISAEHIYVYSSCNSDFKKCVPNAVCYYVNHRGVYDCKCANNTVTSLNKMGYCFVRKGDYCFGDLNSAVTNRTCLPGLVCQNDTCSCLNANHQEYNEKEEKCITLINGPCSESSECTDNSECINFSGLQVCRCRKGFTAVNRKCDLAFGESCVQGQRYPKCDRIGPLQCSVKGKCECLPNEIYDNEKLKCKGLAGAKCKLGNDDFCTDGAECKAFRSSEGKWGICMCLPEKELQGNGKCANGTSIEIAKQP